MKFFFLLKFLSPLDFLFNLHLFQCMFDIFSFLIVSDFDEIGQILSFLKNVRGIFNFRGFFMLQFLDKLINLFLLDSRKFFLVLFQLIDEWLDLEIPLCLKLFDFFFSFFANDLNLYILMTTCYFSRIAMVYFRWISYWPFSCSILFWHSRHH